MKIIRDKASNYATELAEFAVKHDLTMRVMLIDLPDSDFGRFSASFDGVYMEYLGETPGKFCYRKNAGIGDTEDQAIADYAHRISRMRIGAGMDPHKDCFDTVWAARFCTLNLKHTHPVDEDAS